MQQLREDLTQSPKGIMVEEVKWMTGQNHLGGENYLCQKWF